MGALDSVNVQDELVAEGDIRSNLLGNISTHLSSLQGFDVMALELIQNADDAGAKTIRFQITPDHLAVWNDAEFDYCGAIKTLPCPKKAKQNSTGKNAACDFHQITEVGFGGKLRNPDNIGRFGIGFVSVYQVTDQPDILSADQRLTLVVGQGKYQLRPQASTSGTQFILPWARDPDSQTRSGLQCSAVTDELINQLRDDIALTISKSLLFLRNVTVAELLDGENLVARCTIDRNSGASRDSRSTGREIIVSLEPSNVAEHWLVLEADAQPLRAPVIAQFPILDRHKRKTQVTVAIRVEPKPLDTGYLFAFLPTKQATRLPLHINADFYPASSREKAIFEGQHERAWNEMLVKAAAIEIGKNLEFLRGKLSHAGLWNLIFAAFNLRTAPGGEIPKIFNSYWQEIDPLLGILDTLALTRDGRNIGVWKVSIPSSSITVTDAEADVFRNIGGNLLAESLRPFSNALTYQNRARLLTLEHLLSYVDASDRRFATGRTVPRTEIDAFFVPLWSLIDRLAQESGSLQDVRKQKIIDHLKDCPIAIDSRSNLATLSQCFNIPHSIRADVEAVLPEIPLLAKELAQKQNVAIGAKGFSFAVLVRYLKGQMPLPDGWTPPADPAMLKRFYQLLHRLDTTNPAEAESIEILRKLPIWRCGTKFIAADIALLHGDFTDPLGLSELIDNDVLDPSVRGFLEERLKVPKQSPRAFVENVVPRIFMAPETLTPDQYKKLILQLGNHLSLLDDPKILSSLQALPIVPTSDGLWQSPVRTYFWSEHLSKIFGQETKSLWLDTNRVPPQPSAQKFLERIGVRREPSAADLVARLRDIAEKFRPSAETRKIAQEPFYELCSRYSLWQTVKDQESLDAIDELPNIDCLPAIGDETTWYSPSELYAPYQAKAFESQARILAYQDTKRLETKFLEAIDISITPETRLVINHLLQCISSERVFDPKPIYEFLNQQSGHDSERTELQRLCKEACIAVASDRYVRPDRVFWGAVHLPGYAFSLSNDWDRYKQLFSIIGVKESPSAVDFGEILLELLNSYDKTLTPLSGQRLDIYRQCLGALAFAFDDGTLKAKSIWKSLQQSSLALDLLNQPGYPDELLLLDSEWLYSFFDKAIDVSLSRSPVEWLPFLSELGMSPLSEKASVEIDVIEGQTKGHLEYEALLHERTEPIARLLHDKRRELVGKISNSLKAIGVETCTTLNVRAVAEIEGSPHFSDPKPVPAFYSLKANVLTIRTPFVEDLWLHAFNAILHQFLSQVAMTDVASLSMNCAQIMERPDLASCHRFLDTAGIPPLLDLTDPTDQLDLSEEVSLIGDSPESTIAQAEGDHLSENDSQVEGTDALDPDLPDASASPVPTKSSDASADPHSTPPGDPTNEATQPPTDGTGSDSGESGDGNGGGGGSGTYPSGVSPPKGGKHHPKGRPKHKTQRDQALATFIYVRPENSDETEDSDLPDGGEEHRHRMALEVASRKTVCQYESERGRSPEELGQKNPGYDIISVNQKTGETRYIEVKAINGAWNKTGVGLSKTQFLNAQNLGEKFWLYVVEFALEPYPAVSKVLTIQSPALKANYFFFDGGWRGLAEDTKCNPLDAFVEGARGIFGSWGNGTIKTRRVTEEGSVSLIVDIDGKGEKLITPRIANGYMRIFAPGEES